MDVGGDPLTSMSKRRGSKKRDRDREGKGVRQMCLFVKRQKNLTGTSSYKIDVPEY